MKNKKLGVMVATPCYGGQLTEGYLHGILSAISSANKHNFQMHLNTMGNESLITRARNTLVTQFLDFDKKDPDKFTHLMFIDSDIGFNGEHIFRLLESDFDIACGVYPRKSVDWKEVEKNAKEGDFKHLEQKALGYNLNFANPKNLKMQNGFVEVLDAATGFMCIKKEVIQQMFDAHPEYKYVNDINVDQKFEPFMYALFDTMIDPESRRYLSEDYMFCRTWQNMGGTVYLDPRTALNHVGHYTFRGNIRKLFTGENKHNRKPDV